MKIGDQVTYRGDADDAQVNWGSNDDPRGVLSPGSTYTVDRVEVHPWHTKVSLAGIEGRFNSVHFDEAVES